jgi:glycosyltransferase involved in cell wall biosynthesis
MARVAVICADNVGTGWYRAYVPSLALQLRGHDAQLYREIPPKAAGIFDAYLCQRPFSEEKMYRKFVDYARETRAKIYMELDDDYWGLQEDNPARTHWYHGADMEKHQAGEDDFSFLHNMEEFAREADGITTTTEPLRKRLEAFNGNVRVVPNLLPDAQWKVNRPKNRRKVLGWAGGISHSSDIAYIKPAVEAALERPDWEVQVCGLTSYPFKQHPRLKPLNPVDVPKYATIVANFDVGLAPLNDCVFNRAKSDLKFVEYGILSIPAVYSFVGPYKTAIRHGTDGLIAKTPADWAKYAIRLMDDETYRTAMGEAAHKRAKTRLVSAKAHLWEQALDLESVNG